MLSRLIKIFSLQVLIYCAFNANATNYYFSNTGNDANTGIAPSSPWKTLGKLRAFNKLKPGDSILFKRGDVFYGSITVKNSGTVENPITYGAYGIGADPEITGFTKIIKWNNIGNNIWESSSAVSTLATCNMVVINGENIAMGRHPNTGYLTFQSHHKNTSITSNELTGTPNWTGAEAVIRSTQWTLERKRIVFQEGSRITYSNTEFEPTNGFGFFIQNDERTLDKQNEWYYNPNTKRIRIYSTYEPLNVNITSVDTLVTIHGSYINFNNLSFNGANQFAFYNDWNIIRKINIQGCSISYAGSDAIKFAGVNEILIENCKVSNSNNIGINLFYQNQRPILRNNEVTNTGVLPGMGQNVSNSYTAIYSFDNSAVIQNNKIKNSGYIGICAIGDSFIIKNNFVDTFCTVLQDGGGIYTHSQLGINYGRKIINNIVLNGIGAVTGTNDATYFAANGIYLDDNSAHIEISGNSVANCSNNGLFIHNGYNLKVYDNTFYNNSAQFATQNDPHQYTLTGSVFYNNIFFSKKADQLCGDFASTNNDFSLWGKSFKNFYARPIHDSLIIKIQINWDSPANFLTLNDWSAFSGLDQNSKKSPKKIIDTSDLMFLVNTDSLKKMILLPYDHFDVTGMIHSDSIMIAPYSSVILIKNVLLINPPPNSDAGNNQSIVLPENSVQLSGKGSDKDGGSVDFLWTKIRGPMSHKIIDAKSPITKVTALTEGVYLFQLEVRNINGSTATSTVQIIVNPAANIPPIADAGENIIITLPVNNAILYGVGTDADGQITNYLWEKISGPSNFQIINSNAAVTNVTGLTEGVYNFRLSVKDNKGDTASSIMEIIVNAAPNIPPTAISGPNQTITLPANKIILDGSGKDLDGVVSSFMWTKISGPSLYNIFNPLSWATEVSGLVKGTYRFELKVTDDKGDIGKDTVQILVNAPNILPTANAGADITIVLPQNTAYLNGNGSDGLITGYQWKQIAGPFSTTITSEKKATTQVKNLIAGTYEFELTVTDNKGEKGRDTVKVVVALGRESGQEGNCMKIYPNPVKHLAEVEINSENLNSQISLVISDLANRIVYNNHFKISGYKTIEKINMAGFPKGSYVITILFEEKEKQVLRIIKR